MKFIISVDDDRYNAFMERAITAFEEEVKIQRIFITPEKLKKPVPEWWLSSPRRWSLVQAIRTALLTAHATGEDCELFEDDCIFSEDFAERRKQFLESLPDDWDMAYLGGQLLAVDLYPPTVIDDAVILVKNAHRNHAWVCRHRSIQRLVNWLDEPGWPGKHTCDWRIGYLQLKPDFHVYIPRDGWMCGQGASHSQLEDRDYPDRWWHYTLPDALEEQKLWKEWNDIRSKEQKEHIESIEGGTKTT